jgi:hypothetical protein
MLGASLAMIEDVVAIHPAFARSGRIFGFAAFASLGCALSACGGGAFQTNPAPSDISGDYTITLTNQGNGCQFANWTNGSTASDVHLDVQQQASTATATVTGVAGALFDLILGGTPQFQGTVTGSSFSMAAEGSNASMDGQCTYTIKATLTGSSDVDAIQGQLTYTETTNGSSDCGYHDTCSSVQSYAGARAPASDAGGD